jgi:hypothetical protein
MIHSGSPSSRMASASRAGSVGAHAMVGGGISETKGRARGKGVRERRGAAEVSTDMLTERCAQSKGGGSPPYYGPRGVESAAGRENVGGVSSCWRCARVAPLQGVQERTREPPGALGGCRGSHPDDPARAYGCAWRLSTVTNTRGTLHPWTWPLAHLWTRVTTVILCTVLYCSPVLNSNHHLMW